MQNYLLEVYLPRSRAHEVRAAAHHARAVADALARLILASLHHYRGLYAPYNGYHAGGLEDFQQATLLDAEFPYYKLRLAERLLERNLLGDHQQAVRLLAELAGRSILFLEAIRLLEQLQQKHGVRYLAHLDLGAWPRLAAQVEPSLQRHRGFPVFQAYEQLASVIRSAKDSFEIMESIAPLPLRPDRTRAKARQDQLESRLACALTEVEHLRAVIRAMKSSKFWKLRRAWFWLKRRLGSSTE